MDTSLLPPMIGISGINNATSREKIASYVKSTADRPLCITANLTTSAIERGLPYLDDVRNVSRNTLIDIFSRPIPNVINLVRCLRESATDAYPSGATLGRAMRIAGKNCHGIRLSFDDATTDALIDFRKLFPEAIIALDITSTALRSRCGGNIQTLCGLLSGYSEEYDEPLANYVFIEIDERKGKSGFPIRQGLPVLGMLISQKITTCRFGISGSINESAVGLLPEMFKKNWKEISIDGGEALRMSETGELLPDRVQAFLVYAYNTHKTTSI